MSTGVTVKLPQAGAIAQRLVRAAEELGKAQIPAMEESVQLVKRRLIEVSPSGPGHFGGRHLRDSWKTSVWPTSDAIRGSVTTDLPQAIWLNTGAKPHPISPKAPGRVLSVGDSFVAVVRHHPGVRARNIKDQVIRETWPAVLERFAEARTEALRVF